MVGAPPLGYRDQNLVQNLSISKISSSDVQSVGRGWTVSSPFSHPLVPGVLQVLCRLFWCLRVGWEHVYQGSIGCRADASQTEVSITMLWLPAPVICRDNSKSNTMEVRKSISNLSGLMGHGLGMSMPLDKWPNKQKTNKDSNPSRTRTTTILILNMSGQICLLEQHWSAQPRKSVGLGPGCPWHRQLQEWIDFMCGNLKIFKFMCPIGWFRISKNLVKHYLWVCLWKCFLVLLFIDWIK